MDKNIGIRYNEEQDKFEIIRFDDDGITVMVSYKCKGDFVHYQVLNDIKSYMEMGYTLVGY